MTKTTKIFLLILVVAFSIQEPAYTKPTPQNDLLWPQLLSHARLEILWQYDLPLVKNENLARLVVADQMLFALSDKNYLFAFDRQTGQLAFSRTFAQPGLVVLGFRPYKDTVISVIGNELVEIDAHSGKSLFIRGMDFGIACLAARNDRFYYVAGVDGRLRAIRTKDRVKLFEAAAPGRVPITSVVADANVVIFATMAGRVVAISPDRPKRLWIFSAGDTIVGDMVKDKHCLFLASKDTYVYNLDIKDHGRTLWKYQTAAILSRGPQVTEDTVYQYVDNKGLDAIDKDSGRFLYRIGGALDLLAQAGSKAYIYKEPSQIVIADNVKRKQLYTVNISPVSIYATNTLDSKIYLADTKGHILCLRPAGR